MKRRERKKNKYKILHFNWKRVKKEGRRKERRIEKRR
jgi:hypothetical protein